MLLRLLYGKLYILCRSAYPDYSTEIFMRHKYEFREHAFNSFFFLVRLPNVLNSDVLPNGGNFNVEKRK